MSSMRQQVHDQGDNAEAQGELECEDRAAGSDGDQPASPGPGPPDVLEAGPAPGGPLGHNVPPCTVRDGGAAEADTSSTLRDTAEALICTGGLLGLGDRDSNKHCI